MMSQYESISDETLIEAVRRGDGDAAVHLYRRHIDRVHRICYRIVLDRAQVPDCVQEVWLRVFRNLGRFRRQGSFAAWLNSVAAHTAIDYYRHAKRRRRHAEMDDPRVEALEVEPPANDRRLDGALMQRRIQDALAEITVNQRTAFVLRYLEGMALPDIARVLGCRQGTVRTHIRRCLLSLRARLAVELKK